MYSGCFELVLLEAIAATVFVSLLSLSGIVLAASKLVEKNMTLMVSFAAGTLLAVAFLDLVPESIDAAGESAFPFILSGIVAFFVLEKLLFWHHHHSKSHHHPVTVLNLVGDAIHNFLDGIIIAVAFIQDSHLGWTTAIAVAAHEIPQELGDYTVLIYGGFSKYKALLFNLISALFAVAGALSVFFISPYLPGITSFLLPFAAGGLIYIACTDLIPEIKKETEWAKSLRELVCFLAGLGVIWVIISAFE